MKNIAVIGAGISGLAAAYLLSRRHRVQLFEKEQRLGGHTHTVVVARPHGRVALDTGFLVHNDRTYPNLVRLFARARRGHPRLGHVVRRVVPAERARVQQPRRQRVLRAAAEPGQAVAPSLLREIVRFNREAPALLGAPDAERQTLGDFLESRRFGEGFTHRYLFPMASAIWSASLDAIRSFPALTLIRFFDNHGLLSLNAQPTWKVVAGGSHTYIPRLIGAAVGRRPRGRRDSRRVRRSEAGVTHRLPRPARRWRSTRWCSPATAIRCCRCSPIRAIASATSSPASRPRPTWPGCTRTRRCCRCRRGRARRGTTCSPATPTRRRR